MDSACLGRANNGSISVIFGPMFSGKTTELLRRMRRYQVSSDRFPSSPSRPMSR
jgi:thymidine kinase